MPANFQSKIQRKNDITGKVMRSKKKNSIKSTKRGMMDERKWKVKIHVYLKIWRKLVKLNYRRTEVTLALPTNKQTLNDMK